MLPRQTLQRGVWWMREVSPLGSSDSSVVHFESNFLIQSELIRIVWIAFDQSFNLYFLNAVTT